MPNPPGVGRYQNPTGEAPVVYFPEPLLVLIGQGYHQPSAERLVELLLCELGILVKDG